MGSMYAILFIGDDEESLEAQSLINSSGLKVDIRKITPSHPIAVHGKPVLFALSNRFDGEAGIRVFIQNAHILGYRAGRVPLKIAAVTE